LGGKSSQSTQSVAIPSQVLAAYQSVNSKANATANTPFQSYGSGTNADGTPQQFVAPVNSQQTAGIAGVNSAATEAQPYYDAATGTLGNAQAGTTAINDAATGLAAGSAEQVNAAPLTGQDINQYLSPYLGDVLGTTDALANQNNNIAQAGQLGTAIQSGAFGGDRTGLAAANLQQQNQLALNSTNANILNTGYNTALGTAQQQQGVNLAAGQANRTALGAAGSELASIGSTAYGEGANTASELGALGTGAESAGLAGANAQIAAGTVQQQTQQAQDTAEYNQFLQQQSYPFQVDQFLANIAEGTGALSGSTTTTTQPGGFFSDRRLKHSIKKIGKTYDGQAIYSYKMHDDPRTHIGLIAQNVEKKHPEAVGLAGGYKIVDYGAATEKAANRGHFYEGGVVPFRRVAKAGGGPSIVSQGDLSAILQAQEQMYAPMSGGAGVYGGVAGSVPRGGSSRVPAPTGATPHLVTAEGGLRAQPTGAQNVKSTAELYQLGKGIYDGSQSPPPKPTTLGGAGYQPSALAQGNFTAPDVPPESTTTTTTPTAGLVPDQDPDIETARRGGRQGLAAGGDPYSSVQDYSQLDIPDENSHNQLAKAPDLPKPAPSGFQQLMSMGSGMGGMSGMGSSIGSLFSSAGDDGGSGLSDLGEEAATDADARGGAVRRHRDAGGDATDAASSEDFGGDKIDEAPALQQGAPNTSLDSAMQVAKVAAPYVIEAFASSKRGGRIKRAGGGLAGRRGYDGGGDVDPAADPDVSTPDLSGLAAAAGSPTPADVPAAAEKLKMDHGPSWWDRNKGNVLPLLQGVAAMGTAPTRHFGVALAAGLGAGAGAYTPTNQGLANTRQTEAENTGIDIKNQMAQMNLDQYTKMMKNQNAPVAAPSPPAANGETPINIVDAPGYFQNKYKVNSAMTPQEVQNIGQAKFMDKMNGTNYAAEAQLKYENRIQQLQFQSTSGAQRDYDKLVNGVVNAPATGDSAYTNLKQINPGLAAKVAQKVGVDPTNQDAWSAAQKSAADNAAVSIAGQHAALIHQYTGSKYTTEGGTQYDERTNTTPPGPAQQKLSPVQATEPVTYGAGLPVPRSSVAPKGSVINAPPRAPTTQTKAPVPPSTSVSTSSPTQTLSGIDMNAFPKIPAIPAATDQPTLDAAKKRATSNIDVQNEALAPLREQSSAAARNTAVYSQLEKTLANANPREFGPSSASYKALMNFKTYLTGLPPDGLVNQAEADKYLAQLGVGGSKQLLGADQQLRQQEMLMLMAHANPNIDQPLQVIKNLAAFGNAGNEYDLRAANTGIDAIRNHNADPVAVPGAIESQVHRADYINGRLNTPQPAIDYLKAHPEAAPHFKQKYGYLP
jgi:hypothetical protein